MSELLLDVGLAQKLKQAFGRNNWTLAEIDQLCEGDTLGRVRAFLKNDAVFTITVGDGRSVSDLVIAGKYDFICNDTMKFIRSEEFKLAKQVEKVGLVLIGFNYDPSSNEILAELARQGLERPTAEDTLRFGEKYPDEQEKYEIVFFHEQWRSPDGSLEVLVLSPSGGARNLCSWHAYDNKWPASARYAARRARK